MLEISLFMILYPSAQTLCSKETATSLTKHQGVDFQHKMKLYHCESSIKPPLSNKPSFSNNTPAPLPLFRGKKVSMSLLFSAPRPHTPLSGLILHYQIHKRWTDPVWLISTLEVWICFDLWI